MANRKFKGFSLAELLIALLVISIVLAAAIPTMTRKGKSSEQVWRWSIDVPPADRENSGVPAFRTNSTFFGTGSNQSVFIGSQGDPLGFASSDKYFPAQQFNIEETPNIQFTTLGDKLAISKMGVFVDDPAEKTTNKITHFMNSHIAFYNLGKADDSATQNDFEYAGRIVMDKNNIAMGLGSMQNTISEDRSQNPTIVTRGNTAIGHYAMFWNQMGNNNTAIGHSALARINNASENTAVGYEALSKLHRVDEPDNDEMRRSVRNTAIGTYALKMNEGGNDNTAVGTNSLANAMESSYGNTALGSSACNRLNGNNNICIGAGVGSLYEKLDIVDIEERKKHLEPVSNKIEIAADKDTCYSGSCSKDSVGGAPLIEGVSAYTHDNKALGEEYTKELVIPTKNIKNESTRDWKDKQLSINAKYFELRPYNGATNPLFRATMNYGNVASINAFPDRDMYKLVDSGYAIGPNLPSRGVFEFYLATQGAEQQEAVLSLLNFRNSSSSSNDVDVAIFTHPLVKNVHPDYIPMINKFNTNAENEKFDFVIRPINLNNQLELIFAKGNLGAQKPTVKLNSKPLRASNPSGKRYNISIADRIYLNDNEDNTKEKAIKLVFDVNSTAQHTAQFSAPNTTSSSSTSQYSPLYVAENGLFLNAPIPNKHYGALIVDRYGLSIYNKDNQKLINVFPEGESVLFHELKNEYDPNGSLIASFNKLRDELKDYVDQQVNGGWSDIRLKNVSGDSTAGLKEINALEVKNYTYKNDKDKTPHVGVIAQQLQKVFPNSVFEDKSGYLKIKTEEIFYAMVNSIKELSAKVQDLTAKVVGLDKRITELEKQNQELKKQNEEFEKRLEKLEKAIK